MADITNIGIPIDISKGVFNNVELLDGKIVLSVQDVFNSKSVFYNSGFWESEAIDLVGAYKDFDKIVLSKVHQTIDSIAVYFRTSNDGFNWSSYAEVGTDGSIPSPIGRYVQVKVSFTAGLTNETVTAVDFNSDEKANFQQNDFIEMDGSLKLKKNYSDKMTIDQSWNEEGSLLRRTVRKSDFKRIDSLKIT
ncbi:hypothetical protein M6D81_15400 [Paenibacillus sp. J5C_2022]|uniref:hypothetical protein n=1 Tax=Paenibacillus sp. J5C2022 TaxID=2977129 RepID=UPI0021CF4468|nr:hypothetical protein [Paenibacillus sp. J5C2022]MCU6710082.1 hypothetical protein [Paenibacillus sp. J5C2022]